MESVGAGVRAEDREPWQQRCPHSGSHHRQHGFVAHRAEHDVRPDAGVCQRLLHPGLIADQRVRHHRRAVELGQRHRAVGEDARPCHQQVRVVEQLEMLDIAVDAAVEEYQVELADLRLVGLLLEQPDVAAGMLVPQPAHHQRQDHVGHALECAVDPRGAVTVQSAAVWSQKDRSLAAFVDGKVDRPCGARCERDGDDLARVITRVRWPRSTPNA